MKMSQIKPTNLKFQIVCHNLVNLTSVCHRCHSCIFDCIYLCFSCFLIVFFLLEFFMLISSTNKILQLISSYFPSLLSMTFFSNWTIRTLYVVLWNFWVSRGQGHHKCLRQMQRYNNKHERCLLNTFQQIPKDILQRG